MTYDDRADGLTFDTFVIRPDGGLDMVTGRRRAAGEDLSVRLRFADKDDDGYDRWYTRDQLRLATYADFTAASLGDNVRNTTASRKGAVVTGTHGKTRGSGAHVLTPCCGAGRYMKATQESVNCPDCGWMYGVAHFSAGTFWISYGVGKQIRRRPGKRYA